MRKIILLICFIFISFFIASKYNNEFENEFEKDMYEYNRNTEIDINNEFEDDKVIIVFKSKYSTKGISVSDEKNTNFVNYIKNLGSDSKMFETKSINDIFLIEDNDNTKKINHFNQIVEVNLVNHSKDAVIKLCKEAQKHKYVLSAEPSYIFNVENNSVYINEEYYSKQWGLNNNNGIEIEPAWNVVGYGNAKLNVGIIEKAIDSGHSDINVGLNLGGADFSDAHGTHVGGIIGAKKDGKGIIGVSQSTINKFDSELIYETFEIALNNGIRIINISGGFEVTGSQIVNLKSVIKTFGDNGGLIVAAAGNDGVNIDNNPLYPASYANKSFYSDLDNVITVGALNEDGDRSLYSNYGENSVSIYAPGDNILSTYSNHFCTECCYEIKDTNGVLLCELDEKKLQRLNEEFIISGKSSWDKIAEDYERYTGETTLPIASKHHSEGYHYMSGTSMAAPFVTGVAALLLSIDSSLTVDQIKNSILFSADDIYISIPGGNQQRVKKLNAFGAVNYALKNYIDIPTYNLSNGFSKTDNKTIVAGDSFFTDKNGFYKLIVPKNCTCNFNVSSNSALDIQLFNENFVEQNIVDLNSSPNIEEINMSLTAGTYYLKTFYTNNKSSGIITTTITRPHVHDYSDSYTSINYTQHKAYCSCDDYIVVPHIVSQSSYNKGQRFATCLKCGGLASMGFIGGNGINSIKKYITDNGSFILPNGVIVLADEDVENFLSEEYYDYRTEIFDCYKASTTYYFEEKRRDIFSRII